MFLSLPESKQTELRREPLSLSIESRLSNDRIPIDGILNIN